MKFYGQLEKAALEVLSSDPAQGVQGRFWFNSTAVKVGVDDGTNIRYLLRNDQNCVFGNNGTASNNVRFNRAASATLQLVPGSDVTTEGSLSTSLAQFSARHENYADASKPAVGNAGRVIWVSDSKLIKVDDGANWLSVADISTAQTFTNKTLTLPAVDMPLFTDQVSDPSAPAASKTTLYTKGGHVYKIANGGTATQLAEVGVTNAQSVVTKTTTYSATTSDDVIILTGASWTLTLYTAVGNSGKKLTVLHGDTSLTKLYTINTTGGQTVGGVASGSYILSTNSERLSIISDGSNWQILDHNTSTPWSSPAVTSVAATGSACAKNGSPAIDQIIWRRVGNMAHIQMNYKQTAAGTAGTGDYRWSMPANLVIDTTVTGTDSTVYGTSNPTSTTLRGMSVAVTGSVTAQGKGIIIVSSSLFAMALDSGVATGTNYNLGGGITYAVDVWLPISGWQP